MKSDKELIVPALKETLIRRQYTLDQVRFSVKTRRAEVYRLEEELKSTRQILQEKISLNEELSAEVDRIEKLIKAHS